MIKIASVKLYGCMLQDLEEQLEEEEAARQKLQLEKVNVDQRWKKLEEKFAELEDAHQKLLKEKKLMEERATELSSKLTEEEDKAKHVNKQRSKFEAQLQDVEDQLNKEKQVHRGVYIATSFKCLWYIVDCIRQRFNLDIFLEKIPFGIENVQS